LFSFVGFGEDVAELMHAVTPDGLELVEQAVDIANGVDPPAHEPLATSMVLGHEVGPLEHGDMLLHRGEAHRVPPSEVRHGVFAVQHQLDDVAASRIGQRMEEHVRSLVVRNSYLTYNHMVVGYRDAWELTTISK
jgi:hypothetical protein